ncbi:MAG: peptidoglycan DD-metalloendopeptidase family protein [Clostridia bacterium]|nr:peptidoglycan DD-metalloendopeptidase family protein [Clostridia bacterium]
MEHKHAKKRDGGGLYIAICCCILVIALIGYANNVAERNKEEEQFLAEQAGESTVAPEIVQNNEPEPIPVLTPEPEVAEITHEETEIPTPDTAAVAKNEVAEETTEFLAPVGGKILSEFSDKQVYYEAIEEWRTHNGVDLQAEVGDSVAACADGKVSRVFMGSLGYSIRIDHENGLSTVYSNLDENPTVALGDSVKKGDVIGHIGQSALADMCDEPHLHFEVMESGEYKNPSDYLN